ncbi:hypothetical protein AAKU52_003150 [Pedobacter sp. CG_S7]|uniref:hypothetical protein n=1 Tax=Pedobacter sp. CG_S7 TaxID=3143930 RepID=UPI003398EC6C
MKSSLKQWFRFCSTSSIRFGSWVFRKLVHSFAVVLTFGSLFLQSAQMGALPVLYAALTKDVKGGEFIGPDGFQQLRGYPTKVDADEYSNDKEVAQHLWEVSQEMTKVLYLHDNI